MTVRRARPHPPVPAHPGGRPRRRHCRSAPARRTSGRSGSSDGVDLRATRRRPGRAERLEPLPGRVAEGVHRPGAARVRHRRLPHRHRHATPRGHRPGHGPRDDLNQRAQPHPDLPRADRRLSVAPAGPREPLRRPRPDLRASPRLHRGRSHVASYVQDNMVRDFPKDSRPAAGSAPSSEAPPSTSRRDRGGC